jgi:uncharacterized protein YjbJ (UPF0337 family)
MEGFNVASHVSNKGKQVKGRVKEAAGKASGNRELTARGKADQVKAQAKDLRADVKKAGRQVKETLAR